MTVKIERLIFEKIFGLYKKQLWLSEKETELLNLLELCDSKVEQLLLLELLGEFTYISQSHLSDLLNQMTNYIIENSGFEESKVQIAAIAFDKQADSSQAILHLMKLQLSKKGWRNVQTVNSFGNILKTINRYGLKQIVLVDEFIGSGSTLIKRLEYLQKNSDLNDCQIKCCFMAGMESTLNNLRNDLGIEIFCPLVLKKGISEKYDLNESSEKIINMKMIEGKLDQLSDEYSLGYNQVEALYSAEGVEFNTPNSVFPIFWWPKANNSDRKTILNRYQKNLL